MPVIKNHLAGSFVKDAIVLDMSDLRRQADHLLDAAKAKAQRVLDEGQTQARELATKAEADAKARGHEQGLAQGLEQGLKAGHAEALAKAQAQFQQLQQGWLAAAQAWDEQRIQMDREARQAILQLGLIFAEKIVQRVIQVDPMVIVDQLAEALAYVMRPTDVTVHIHPADKPALQEAMPQLLEGLPQLQHVHLAEDESISRGGCSIAYGQGRIDATIQTQFKRLVELMIPSEETHAEPGKTIDTQGPAASPDTSMQPPAAENEIENGDENESATT